MKNNYPSVEDRLKKIETSTFQEYLKWNDHFEDMWYKAQYRKEKIIRIFNEEKDNRRE